jgi:hypothetical protein
MNVFISYSVHDTGLVMLLASQLGLQGHSVNWWSHSKEPGKEVWPQIFGWIDQADLVLAVITDRTVGRAMSVGHEVGHAKAKGKMIIPLVSHDVDNRELGFLSSITQIRFDPRNPWPAIMELQQRTRPVSVSVGSQPSASPGTALLVVGALVLLAIGLSKE